VAASGQKPLFLGDRESDKFNFQHFLFAERRARRGRRMGLMGDDRAKPSVRGQPASPQKIGECRSGASWTPAFHRPPPVVERKLRSVEIAPRHLAVTELERGDCRYPYGGDEEGEAITFLLALLYGFATPHSVPVKSLPR
jgi:hypothetical protein